MTIDFTCKTHCEQNSCTLEVSITNKNNNTLFFTPASLLKGDNLHKEWTINKNNNTINCHWYSSPSAPQGEIDIKPNEMKTSHVLINSYCDISTCRGTPCFLEIKSTEPYYAEKMSTEHAGTFERNCTTVILLHDTGKYVDLVGSSTIVVYE